MKKVLGIMAMAIMLVLPLSVKAEEVINHKCGTADSNGFVTCTLTYNISDTNGWDEMTINLFEYGGATVTNITNAADSEWQIEGTPTHNGTTWEIVLSGPSVKGQGNILTFTYKVSGTADCKITYGLKDNEQTPIVPDKPTPETPQTGATLPYIALGAIVVIATGAYIATRNKSKMYRI